MNPEASARVLRRGLYAITNGPRDDLLIVCEAALRGGARVLQYRDTTLDTSRRRREATALAALCGNAGVPLIVEGDIELAAACDANGVHLGDPQEIARARQRLGPQALIGLSCRASIDLAHEAAACGADYISFGAFFDSPTLPHATRAHVSLLEDSAKLGLPRVAIGGVTPDNGARLLAAGAQMLAAISSVFDAADPATAARNFAALF